MDLTGAFVFYFTVWAIAFMAIGAGLFWFLTSAVPYLWQHIHWI